MTWYALAVVVIVIAVDLSRTFISYAGRAALRERRRCSSNALHFGSDLAARPRCSSACCSRAPATRTATRSRRSSSPCSCCSPPAGWRARNVDVLMDRAPAGAQDAARARDRRARPAGRAAPAPAAAGRRRHFIDVVIGVSPGAAVGQGHAAADAVESALERALPESDVVVHVEPVAEQDVRDRAQAAALSVPRVREVHNSRVVAPRRPAADLAAPQAPGRALRSTRRTRSPTAVEQRDRRARPGGGRRPDAHRAAAPSRSPGRAAGQRRAGETVDRVVARGDRLGPRATSASSRPPTASSPREHRARRRHAARGGPRLARARSRSRSAASAPELSDVVIHTEP